MVRALKMLTTTRVCICVFVIHVYVAFVCAFTKYLASSNFIKNHLMSNHSSVSGNSTELTSPN